MQGTVLQEQGLEVVIQAHRIQVTQIGHAEFSKDQAANAQKFIFRKEQITCTHVALGMSQGQKGLPKTTCNSLLPSDGDQFA
jgi:predicted mannosyl-3-phosphoglycerate phosphatase (HAD superfamily)